MKVRDSRKQNIKLVLVVVMMKVLIVVVEALLVVLVIVKLAETLLFKGSVDGARYEQEL